MSIHDQETPTAPVRIGLLGCGTVGTGVLKILRDNRRDIEARLGARIEVVGIAVSDVDKARDPIVDRELLTEDANAVVTHPDVQVVVEVMGGYEPARTLLLSALESGKHVVTANKALLAKHGTELFRTADTHRRDVIFEASVGGGIPIIRTLREGLASDRIATLHAIINGTSNFILTEMTQHGRDYADVLAQAQELGYAEADPTMDVAGIDAAQKLSILIAIAYGADVDFEDILAEGIDTLDARDAAFAKQFGYTIKPMAIAKARDAGIEARVHPTLVPEGSMLGSVNGVFNTVRVDSHALGPVLFYGQGAGMMPTAASVVSDVIELGRNLRRGTSGRLPHLAFHRDLVSKRGACDHADIQSAYYLRFSVRDEPGVLAALAGILGHHSISISRMIQEDDATTATAQVVMVTHEASEGAVRAALASIHPLPFIVGPTHLLRVEDVH